HALGRVEGGVHATLEADRLGFALDDAGQAHAGGANQLDDGGVGVDFADAADDAAAEDDGSADGDAVVLDLADDDPLPPAREIPSHHARDLGAVVGIGRQFEQFLEPDDLGLKAGVLLHG